VLSDGFCGGLWEYFCSSPCWRRSSFALRGFFHIFLAREYFRLCVYGSDGCAVGPRALRDNAICVSLEEGLLTQQVIFLPCFFVFSDGRARNACGKEFSTDATYINMQPAFLRKEILPDRGT